MLQVRYRFHFPGSAGAGQRAGRDAAGIWVRYFQYRRGPRVRPRSVSGEWAGLPDSVTPFPGMRTFDEREGSLKLCSVPTSTLERRKQMYLMNEKKRTFRMLAGCVVLLAIGAGVLPGQVA